MGQIESHGCASPRRPEVPPGEGPPLSYLTGTFLPSPASPQTPDPRIRAELCEGQSADPVAYTHASSLGSSVKGDDVTFHQVK